MIIDYFIIRRGNVDIHDLFTLSHTGRYHYFHGFNLRAFAAFVIGFLLPLPGFAASFGHPVGETATHMYSLGWVLSFIMGGGSYYLACLIWPVQGGDGKLAFESQVAKAQVVVLDGVDSMREDVESVGEENIQDYSYTEKGVRVTGEAV